MAENRLSLTADQWSVLHAIELGNLNLETIRKEIEALATYGLVERYNRTWRPTQEGRTLIAMRRQI